MSLLNQTFSSDFLNSLSTEDRVYLVKEMIVEYQETHTKEEFDQLIGQMESVARDQ